MIDTASLERVRPRSPVPRYSVPMCSNGTIAITQMPSKVRRGVISGTMFMPEV